MADARVVAGVTLLCAVACCAPAPRGPATAPQATTVAVTFPEDGKPLPRYHSRRLSLSLPLPDGKAWRIDDHSRPELLAKHAPTRSRILISVFRADGLVGRSQCEDLARAKKLVPDGSFQIVEDTVAMTQVTFDTRIEVALQPGSGPDRGLAGHVMAFGGFLRKCYVFVYSTEVDSASDEAALSSRLAFVRARVLRDLELEPFDLVPRDTIDGPSAGPKLAPAR